MRNLLKFNTMNIILLILFCLTGICFAQITVNSPDTTIKLVISGDGGGLTYSILYKDKPVIERSPLVMSIDGAEITRQVEIKGVENYEVNEEYPWRGVHSRALNKCKGAKVSIQSKALSWVYTVELRAYNDGAAFRIIVPGRETARVPDESTVFTLPAGSVVWYHDLNGHYEGVHSKKQIQELTAGEWAAPPVTFKLPRNIGYASITESALFNYSGMALQANGKRGFTLALGHKHPISYPFRLRYSNDIDRVSKPAQIAGTIITPWRVVLIGSDLNALVNCDIVHNLCPPPDKTLFPNGMQTDWIKPGRAVWRYLDGGATTLEAMKEFSRLAGELGFEYHILEGFWSRWSDEQIKELVEYSRARGVGLWFWKHSRQLRTAQEQTEFFKKLSELGVVGAKIDFFDHEHKDVVDLYGTLLREAAKYKIMVNFHGANKPTGESRTYPNELLREAVRGMEAGRLKDRAWHDATLPFTRYLAGHADYTPVHFGQRRSDTTWTHQIATAVVFTAPLLTYAAHPTNLLSNPAVDMIKSIPSVWDETIVLPPSEIGEVAVFARRNGARWFLAVVNGPVEKTFDVKLNFLGNGNYKTMLVKDDLANPASVKIENTTLTRNNIIKIELSAGGGFIARFEPISK